MSGPRVVFITRRFWPLFGGAETVIGNLAAALATRGMKPTIVTACWEPHWPREIVHRSVRVVRLPQPPHRMFGTWWYMKELAIWLRHHRGQYDLVYVSQLKHDAYVAVRAARRLHFPVIVRATGAGKTGDCDWQATARCGGRIRRVTRRAAAVIAPSSAIEAELLAAGYRAEQIVRLDSGVPIPEARTPERRTQARQTIGESNPALSLDDKTPLAVYTGRLDAAKGLATLIAAWATIARRRPAARLWLVGEGPEHAALEGQIQSLGLVGRVDFVGSFDTVEDMLLAADVFVLPSFEEGLSIALLEAMSVGLPAVASDIVGNRIVVEPSVTGLLVPPGDATALVHAIERVFEDENFAVALGAAARRCVQEHYSIDRMVDDHLALFRRVLTIAP
jgi:glycosyltransferase involved in cell wall biosynthesis